MTFTYAGVLTDLARRTPDATALVLDDAVLSFAELDERGTRLAHVLADLGVAGQQRVGFLGKNAPVFFELLLACSLRDAVLVGLNWRLAGDELAAIVADAGLTALVCSPELREVVTPVAARLGFPVIGVGAGLDDLIAAAPSTPVASTTTGESVVLQLYSSGTTGLPKGTLITNDNLAFTQTSGRLLYGMDERSVNLVPSPLFHIGGVGYGTTALSQGGTTVLVPDSEPATLVGAIERHRVTHAFMVPAVIQNLVRWPALAHADLSSLTVVAYGGAPMSEALLQSAIAALGCEFLGVYGMTETSGTVVALAAEHHDPGGPRAHLLRSIGRALPWAADVELRDPVTLTPVEAGAVGEIWVRSGQVTPGYWRQPEVSAEALTADGWLRTGDAAYSDDEGFLYLHDRMKDMVITGGENVYPAEVENVLAHHPAVVEVAVIGVPSERWGETVKALVVVDPSVAFDEAELIGFARQRLAHYKCPKAVEIVELLPRNASGKILKKELRMTHGGALQVTDTILPLVRRWAVDWINGHDSAACADLMVPDYALRIGTFELATRAAYVDATVGQLAQFPGLVLTVHEVLTDGTRAAIRFSEHGASLRHEGRAAAWTGVVLFEGDGSRLVRTWAEEDYAARRRQLATGLPDPVGSPAVAPWDTPAETADPAAEDVVRRWLEAGLPPVDGVKQDDAAHDDAGPALVGESGEVDVVMSAGERVAFHGRVHGVAADGSGAPGTVDVAGLVHVEDGRVRGGSVVTDRLSVLSALKRARA